MRLLDARTLHLVEVRDDAVPPYAILSHTWGERELTFQALQRLGRHKAKATGHNESVSIDRAERDAVEANGDVADHGPPKKRKKAARAKLFLQEHSQGYQKISQTAALAVSRGFSYLWVDTCCIDKTSSSELSEAINSMYAWYQRAGECYVYLADVDPILARPVSSSTPPARLNWSSEENRAVFLQLKRSRWFRRGWTLQELIAPKTVIFYANDWTPLGERDDDAGGFQSTIAKITGIDNELLDGRIEPSQLSIATRMSWAAHRETTRPEDLAYCLMGLFDVNMPLLYGEGMKAFLRLQGEIIARNDDQSIYAWQSVKDDSLSDSLSFDPDALSGLLATHPNQFRDARDIQALPPSPFNTSMPSTMTNHGLQVQLWLAPVREGEEVPMEEDFYAILDCFVVQGVSQRCPAIRLRKLTDDQYGRLEAESMTWFPPVMQDDPYLPRDQGHRTIFVRQQPVYYHMPEFRIDPALSTGRLDTGRGHRGGGSMYRLKDIHPARQWNSRTMTMRAKYSRKLRAMGLFRLEHVYSSDIGVDIVVGLRRLDAMQWEGWCFQRAWTEETRSAHCGSVLETVNQRIAELDRRYRRPGILNSNMLREHLGDDARLVTIVNVQALQLQGRLYISVSVSAKEELEAGKAVSYLPYLPPGSEATSLKGLRILRVPLLREFRLQLLTSPLSVEDNTPNERKYAHGALRFAVRIPPMTGVNNQIRQQLDNFFDTQQAMLINANTKDPEVIERIYLLGLGAALFSDDDDRMRKSLAHVTDIHRRTSDPYGLAPIHWAVASGSQAMIQAMCAAGADISQTTECGWTALHIAAVSHCSLWKQNQRDTFEMSDDNTSKLHDCVQARSPQHGDTPCHLAAAWCAPSYAGLEYFEALWEKALDCQGFRLCKNHNEETPLHRAAAANNDKIVRFLISDFRMFLDARSTFLDHGDRLGRTPLWHATAAGATDALHSLLLAGASPHLADDLGLTPLHAACRMGRAEAVGLLTKHDVLKTVLTANPGFSPLDFAAMWDHVDCLRQLLWPLPPTTEQAALFHACNRALHIATSCNSLACAKELYTYGARHSIVYPAYYVHNSAAHGVNGTGIFEHVRVVDEALSAMEVARKLGLKDMVDLFLHRDALAVEMPDNESFQVPARLSRRGAHYEYVDRYQDGSSRLSRDADSVAGLRLPLTAELLHRRMSPGRSARSTASVVSIISPARPMSSAEYEWVREKDRRRRQHDTSYLDLFERKRQVEEGYSTTVDPELGLVEYGTDSFDVEGIYRKPTEKFPASRSRSRRRSTSRLRGRASSPPAPTDVRRHRSRTWSWSSDAARDQEEERITVAPVRDRESIRTREPSPPRRTDVVAGMRRPGESTVVEYHDSFDNFRTRRAMQQAQQSRSDSEDRVARRVMEEQERLRLYREREVEREKRRKALAAAALGAAGAAKLYGQEEISRDAELRRVPDREPYDLYASPPPSPVPRPSRRSRSRSPVVQRRRRDSSNSEARPVRLMMEENALSKDSQEEGWSAVKRRRRRGSAGLDALAGRAGGAFVERGPLYRDRTSYFEDNYHTSYAALPDRESPRPSRSRRRIWVEDRRERSESTDWFTRESRHTRGATANYERSRPLNDSPMSGIYAARLPDEVQPRNNEILTEPSGRDNDQVAYTPYAMDAATDPRNRPIQSRRPVVVSLPGQPSTIIRRQPYDSAPAAARTASADAQQSVTLPVQSKSTSAGRHRRPLTVNYLPAQDSSAKFSVPPLPRYLSQVDSATYAQADLPSRYQSAPTRRELESPYRAVLDRSSTTLVRDRYSELDRPPRHSIDVDRDRDAYGASAPIQDMWGQQRDRKSERRRAMFNRPVSDKAGLASGDLDDIAHYKQPETDPSLLDTVKSPPAHDPARTRFPIAVRSRTLDGNSWTRQPLRRPRRGDDGMVDNLRDLMGQLNINVDLADEDGVSPIDDARNPSQLAPDAYKHEKVRVVAMGVELDATALAPSVRSVSPEHGSTYGDESGQGKDERKGKGKEMAAGLGGPLVPNTSDGAAPEIGKLPYDEDGAFSSTWMDMGYYGYGRR